MVAQPPSSQAPMLPDASDRRLMLPPSFGAKGRKRAQARGGGAKVRPPGGASSDHGDGESACCGVRTTPPIQPLTGPMKMKLPMRLKLRQPTSSSSSGRVANAVIASPGPSAPAMRIQLYLHVTGGP